MGMLLIVEPANEESTREQRILSAWPVAVSLAERIIGPGGNKEDAIQEAMLAATRAVDEWRNAAQWSTFAYRVMRNAIINYLERSQSPEAEPVQDGDAVDVHTPDGECEADEEERIAKQKAMLVAEYLDSQPSLVRRVLFAYADGTSIPIIVDREGISRSTVAAILGHVQRECRRRWDERVGKAA